MLDDASWWHRSALWVLGSTLPSAEPSGPYKGLSFASYFAAANYSHQKVMTVKSNYSQTAAFSRKPLLIVVLSLPKMQWTHITRIHGHLKTPWWDSSWNPQRWAQPPFPLSRPHGACFLFFTLPWSCQDWELCHFLNKHHGSKFCQPPLKLSLPSLWTCSEDLLVDTLNLKCFL